MAYRGRVSKLEGPIMKVCFVCSEYPPGPHGGIGTATQLLARALVDNGHRVKVAGVYSSKYQAPDYREDRGVQVYSLQEPRVYLGWAMARCQLFKMIQSWSRTGQIDIVEVPDYQGWAAGWPQLPVPVVTRIHGSATLQAHELNRPLDRVTRVLERWSLKRADALCSVSHHAADITRKAFRLNHLDSTVLHNFVEVPSRPLAASSRDRNCVVFTGTLTEKKGVISLAEAWPMVLKEHPEATLHLYGKDSKGPDGPSMKEFLMNWLSSTSLDRVSFHGHLDRSDLLQALSRARAGVFPSYTEAFGIAPLEAMATGCPTIFTRRATGPELIDEGTDGLLVDPDRPEAIAKAIVRLLKDDELACRIGEAGRRKAEERFSRHSALGQNEMFYAKCVADFKNCGSPGGRVITAVDAAREPQPGVGSSAFRGARSTPAPLAENERARETD